MSLATRNDAALRSYDNAEPPSWSLQQEAAIEDLTIAMLAEAKKELLENLVDCIDGVGSDYDESIWDAALENTRNEIKEKWNA